MAKTPTPVNGSGMPPGQNPPIPDKDPYTEGSGGWPIPVMTEDMTFRDIGSHGLRQYGGWVREEFLPQLVGRQAARTYREMLDNSTTVGSINFAVVQLMREVDWRVVAASDKPEAQKEQEFVESLRNDMSHTWGDFLVEALSMLGYGWSTHEIVYKKRQGRQPSMSPVAGSKFDDGRIGWRRLPIRGQDTILKWFFNENGMVKGVTQQPWVGQLVDIPIEKMLLFRPTAHKNNPEGRSILRNCYRPYYMVKRLEEQEAIMFERMGGLPVLYVPSELLEAVATNDAKAIAAFERYKKMVTNVRIDEQMGIILPSNPYTNANGVSSVRMYDFQLLTPGGSGSRMIARSNEAIERYKLDMLMTVLADFIQLGHASRGLQNLALSKVDMFYSAIEGWLNSIADVINRHGLPRLWDLNGLDYDLMPEYVPDLAQRVDLDSLGNFVWKLAQSGMSMFPDEDLENYIREAAGLPDISEERDYAETDIDEMLATLPAAGQQQLPAGQIPAGTTPDQLQKSLYRNTQVPNDAAAIKKVLLASYARRILKLKQMGQGRNLE